MLLICSTHLSGGILASDFDAQLAPALIYTKRGQKNHQGASTFSCNQKQIVSINTGGHHIPSWLQDWASAQATQTRAVLGHLHTLARKSVSSRHWERCLDQFLDAHTGLGFWSLLRWCRNQRIHVLKTLYLRLTGKQVWWLHRIKSNRKTVMKHYAFNCSRFAGGHPAGWAHSRPCWGCMTFKFHWFYLLGSVYGLQVDQQLVVDVDEEPILLEVGLNTGEYNAIPATCVMKSSSVPCGIRMDQLPRSWSRSDTCLEWIWHVSHMYTFSTVISHLLCRTRMPWPQRNSNTLCLYVVLFFVHMCILSNPSCYSGRSQSWWTPIICLGCHRPSFFFYWIFYVWPITVWEEHLDLQGSH